MRPSGRALIPTRSITSSTVFKNLGTSIMPNRWVRSEPRNRLDLTVMSGAHVGSWGTSATPISWALGELYRRMSTGSPRMRISPDVAGSRPAITFIRTDLPAPFLPTMP